MTNQTPTSRTTSRTKIKICGIGNADDLCHAHRIGASWAGMTFCAASPRNLTLDAARAIREATADTPIMRVALIVDADDAAIATIIGAAAPAMLQCHGSETPERCAAIGARFEVAVMKALPIRDAASLSTARAYDDAAVCDMLLFDAPPPDNHATRPGGHGAVFDWGILREWNGALPWMLAGGLTPDNVAAAIAETGAGAVDVASGVESAPGIKDHAAMERFVNAAIMG